MKKIAPILAVLLCAAPWIVEAQRTPIPIKPGAYECKISKEYKMRPCTVEVTESGATLKITEGNHLFHVTGDIYPMEKKQLLFEGKLAGEDPFPCQYSKPYPEARTACMNQRVSAVLKKKGKGFTGKIRVKFYQAFYEGKPPNRAAAGWEVKGEEYLFSIRPKK